VFAYVRRSNTQRVTSTMTIQRHSRARYVIGPDGREANKNRADVFNKHRS